VEKGAAEVTERLNEKRDEAPNIFPGNWDIDSPELLKMFELSFEQNWSPVKLPWDNLDPKSFDEDEAIGQAYWMAKLALFEKSGIGGFGQAMMQAARHNVEDPTKKFLGAVTFDECKHDDVCRRACTRLCPGFPYHYKPKTQLQEMALRNIWALYENGKRYWSAFENAWNKFSLELIFSGFFFAEIGAQVTFTGLAERSRNKFYLEAFTNITRDESRHLAGTLSMMERLSVGLNEKEKFMISRQMKHGFIYLSPLLFTPMSDFWHLPADFVKWDRKLEEIAYEAGMGVPTFEQKKQDWQEAILRQKVRLEDLGIKLPAIKEVGIDGIEIPVKKNEEIVAIPL
jgi:rubrerythrin